MIGGVAIQILVEMKATDIKHRMYGGFVTLESQEVIQRRLVAGVTLFYDIDTQGQLIIRAVTSVKS